MNFYQICFYLFYFYFYSHNIIAYVKEINTYSYFTLIMHNISRLSNDFRADFDSQRF